MGKPQKPEAWSPIVPVRSGSASKLNGGGVIEYEVGREHQQLHIRITKNDSSGTFGKEWMAWSAVRPLLDEAKKTGQLVHSSLFRSVIASKSQNTPGFLAAALRKEGLLAATEEGSTLSNVVGDPAQWEEGMMQLSYVPAVEPPPQQVQEPMGDNVGLQQAQETAEVPQTGETPESKVDNVDSMQTPEQQESGKQRRKRTDGKNV
jgi:hypothetical protein